MIRRIIRWLMVLIVLMLIIYVVIIKLPPDSVRSKDTVAEISAEDLYQAFMVDESEAQKLYLGKALLVSGEIDEKYQDEDGAPGVILKGESGDPAVMVTLESSEQSKLDKYQPGGTVKIKALCSGLLMEVTLNKGVIIEE